MVKIPLALTCGLILFWCATGYALEKSEAVKAVIGESENQGFKGMEYVSCAIRNRGTLKGVYGLHNDRVTHKRYSKKIYAQAQKAWEQSAWSTVCRDIQGAKDWENTQAFGLPYWAKNMKIVFIYKAHRFFK